MTVVTIKKSIKVGRPSGKARDIVSNHTQWPGIPMKEQDVMCSPKFSAWRESGLESSRLVSRGEFTG